MEESRHVREEVALITGFPALQEHAWVEQAVKVSWCCG